MIGLAPLEEETPESLQVVYLENFLLVLLSLTLSLRVLFSVPWSSGPLESATLPLPGAPPAFLIIISHSVLVFFTADIDTT